MSEWIKSNALVLITLAVLICGGAYAHGQMVAAVENLQESEDRQEIKIDEIAERLAHLEGATSRTTLED